MRTLTPEEISQIQKDPAKIRNLCILAHVDHGKTTLADSLLASNGIISKRMAGKLRYMDSRPDEQERGITMKSSAIALHHIFKDSSYFINLIDSPGHVDFAGEVSTAVRVCDGAIIVVDVVEGCAPQTVQVLRQAWSENLRTILVLNKIDRLMVEKNMSPMEMYTRLVQVLEQINAVVGSLYMSETIQRIEEREDRRALLTSSSGENIVYDWNEQLEEEDDSQAYFQPEMGNVVFASAVDGWGFVIDDFAEMYAKKLGVNRNVLRQTLWGDFYLNAKEKKIQRKAQAKGKKPLFVQFILENIWQAYDAVCQKKDKELTDKIIRSLDLKIPARELRQNDPRGQLATIFSAWLPLGKSILDRVCERLPCPTDLREERVKRLIANQKDFDSLPDETRQLKDHFLKCSAGDDAPIIVYVAKLVRVDPQDLLSSKNVRKAGTNIMTAEEIAERREKVRRIAAAGGAGTNMEENGGSVTTTEDELVKKEVFLAFARVFSGKVREGAEVYALGPKHDPEKALEIIRQEGPDAKIPHVAKLRIGALYLMMGREYEQIEEASAGNVIGIAGVEEHLVRSGTLSSTLACPAFADLTLMVTPIVRVAVEPKHMRDLNKLVDGLKLLSQADACVEVFQQETGEHVLVTAGEVHLQRCLEDLKNSFAKIEINASEPIVPFRETIVLPRRIDMVNEAVDMTIKDPNAKARMEPIEASTPDKQCTVLLRAHALPPEFSKLLDENAALLKALHRLRKKTIEEHHLAEASAELRNKIKTLREQLEEILRENKEYEVASIPNFVDRICCFGPRNCGPNILVNLSDHKFPIVWPEHNSEQSAELSPALLNGFQMATLAGPLCEEPMMGVCFAIHDLRLAEAVQEDSSKRAALASISGQLISVMKDGCRRAFQLHPQRLMVAMYSCEIQVPSDALGRAYGVINKRRGRVLSDEMQSGSDIFNICTTLPVCESFGFADEIRKRTSGLAIPQLVFSHWEVLDVDPFWIPTTEEEYMHFGEKADSDNVALKYMNQIRRRKGLYVEEKVVAHAEKQRTLGRNK